MSPNNFLIRKNQFIKRQSYYYIETSQLIWRANQLTGFYMMATLAFNELVLAGRFRKDPLVKTR